jgi:hypothetical protein
MVTAAIVARLPPMPLVFVGKGHAVVPSSSLAGQLIISRLQFWEFSF